MIKKTLGGDRLGSGSKMTTSLHGFNRDKHDLSYIWRSSMNAGTLIPFMKILTLPGDTFDIDINALVKTNPTIRPLYGTYKLQLDVFQYPLRLAQAALHNNPTNVGLRMEDVKLPQIKCKAISGTEAINASSDINHYQFSPSCLMTYFNVKGVMHDNTVNETEVERDFQCVPILAYYEIFKNYYANKMEENAYVIGPKPTNIAYFSEVEIDGGVEAFDTTVFEPSTAIPIPRGSSVILRGNFKGTRNQIFNSIELDLAYYDRTDELQYTSLGYIYKLFGEQGKIWEINISSTEVEIKNIASYDMFLNGVRINEQWNSLQTELIPFPLKNIDQMRADVLSTNNIGRTFYIDQNTYMPYGINAQILDASNQNFKQSKNFFDQNGILVKTYLSDKFNNFVTQEYVETITEQTKVDIQSGFLNINDLNLAEKLYNLNNRIAVSGATYEDWMEAVWGSKAPNRCESPIYCGGLSNNIFFDEVVSTSQTSEDNENGNLGSLAGRGMVDMDQRKGGRITIHVEEPSYIIGIVSITPRQDYYQGNDFDMTELKSMNDLHKPSLDQIGFQPLLAERVAWWAHRQVAGSKEVGSVALAMQPAWIEYMTNVNQVYGDFCRDTKDKAMVLARDYEYSPEGIQDFTTYIDPAKWNYPFAMKSLEVMPFKVQISIETKPSREVSAQIIPNV